MLQTHPGLEELLQHLKLLLGPGTRVFWSDFELQRLVVLWVESHAAFQDVGFEHDHARLVGVDDGQLRVERERGQSQRRSREISREVKVCEGG